MISLKKFSQHIVGCLCEWWIHISIQVIRTKSSLPSIYSISGLRQKTNFCKSDYDKFENNSSNTYLSWINLNAEESELALPDIQTLLTVTVLQKWSLKLYQCPSSRKKLKSIHLSHPTFQQNIFQLLWTIRANDFLQVASFIRRQSATAYSISCGFAAQSVFHT